MATPNLTKLASGAAVAAVVAATLLIANAALGGPPPRAHAEGACDSTIDLVLVLDGSESINWAQFGLLKTFTGDVVAALEIGPSDGHVGIVQFAGEGEGVVEVALTGDLATIQAGIAAMAQIVGVTDIQEGIALGQGQLTTNGRDGVPHVMVVLTDGAHNEPGDLEAEATAAKAMGTEIFAIAIGDGPKLDQLTQIVSGSAETHIFEVDDFESLVTILGPVIEVVCQAKPTATPEASATPTPTATPTQGGPASSGTITPVSEPLGVTQLPSTGDGLLPSDWAQRGAWLSAQALAGLGGAFVLVAAGYAVTRRREQ